MLPTSISRTTIRYMPQPLKALFILKDLDKGIKTNWSHILKGECLQNNFSKPNNAMYQLFWLLGNIMTMPAYLMTCLGTPCEKKYSLSMLKLLSDSSLR